MWAVVTVEDDWNARAGVCVESGGGVEVRGGGVISLRLIPIDDVKTLLRAVEFNEDSGTGDRERALQRGLGIWRRSPTWCTFSDNQ
jgi:hypothetical protein